MAHGGPAARGYIARMTATDHERRGDREAADLIEKALRMQSAFGQEAARQLLERNGVGEEVVKWMLLARYDRRQRPGYGIASTAAFTSP